KFYCLFANNGTEVWNTTSFGSASPVITGGMVYYNPSVLYCYYANNGTQVWSQTNGGDGYSSPAVGNGKVVVNDLGDLYCYYSNNGTELWSTSILGAGCSSPVISGDGKILINGGSYTYCLNEKSGLEIWTRSTGGPGYSSPALANDSVFVNQGTIYCFKSLIPDITSPIITSVYPQNGAVNISFDENISVTFNESMNNILTQNAFLISPNNAGSFNWQSQTMIFNSNNDLLPSQTYTITINTSARDFSGNRLDGNGNGIFEGSPTDDFIWWFTTKENTPPQIISTTPENNGINVSLNANIEITFDEPMNQSSIVAGFYSSPILTGSFNWNGNIMTFDPNNDLNPETAYTITVASQCTDLIGNQLDGDADGLAEG
ncbi:MAG: Ig-like domain-containing protein, partial [Thermoplasmata archaeon]|nr:Ig-like domain-containing protein [Thermoplasmata archaeon]